MNRAELLASLESIDKKFNEAYKELEALVKEAEESFPNILPGILEDEFYGANLFIQDCIGNTLEEVYEGAYEDYLNDRFDMTKL